MEQIRKLPIGIQTFDKLREGGFLYVDKTAMIYQIASTSTPYFLSRPRRFGKSLLISTFELTSRTQRLVQAWPSNSWKRSGNSILFYILT